MSQPRPKKSNNHRNQPRNGRGNEQKPIDIWRTAPPLPDPEPIVAVERPDALVRSLGSPPLPGVHGEAGYLLAAVTRRAAALAAALATSADLLRDRD